MGARVSEHRYQAGAVSFVSSRARKCCLRGKVQLLANLAHTYTCPRSTARHPPPATHRDGAPREVPQVGEQRLHPRHAQHDGAQGAPRAHAVTSEEGADVVRGQGWWREVGGTRGWRVRGRQQGVIQPNGVVWRVCWGGAGAVWYGERATGSQGQAAAMQESK